MFFGEFEYRIDEKGRIPIPPKFRRELREGLVLTPGLEKCVVAYPVSEWKKLAETLTTGSITPSKLRKLIVLFLPPPSALISTGRAG